MGFGLLFIGYIFFLYILPVGIELLSIAAAILLYALYKLSRYHVGFRHASVFSALLLLSGMPSIVYLMLRSYGVSTLPYQSTVLSVCAAASWLLLFALHFYLFDAISELAKTTSLLRLQVAATRNRIFSCVFLFLRFAAEVLTPYANSLSKELALKILSYTLIGLILFGLIIAALNLRMLFSAYVHFCPLGQEDRGVKEYQQFIDKNKQITLTKKEDRKK